MQHFPAILSLLIFINHNYAVGMKKIPITSVTGVKGGSASLPCDVSHPKGDSIVLLLWFKDGKTTPIYRYDARSSSASSSHWADETLSARASLEVSSDPAFFTLKRVSPKDASFYKCRVDFLRQPTKTTRTYLAVVVPPSSVNIYQNNNLTRTINSVVGPYFEGETLQLTCVAKGGDPKPQVVWFEDTQVLDNKMETAEKNNLNQKPNAISSERSHTQNQFGGDPFNTLILGPLERKHFKMLLTCEASNNNITLPTSLVVMVDLNLPPLGLNIHAPQQPLIADKKYAFVCESFGGRPSPSITWFRNGEQLTIATHREVSADGNATRSRFHMTPVASDDGTELKCVAEALTVTSKMERFITLTVHYVPQASIRFGASLDSTNIKEGDDIYFECIIEANPKIIRVSWRHNNEVLTHNITTGVIISNQSLVLQKVTRQQAGSYTCHAYNILGDGSSKPLVLDIKYSPVCGKNQITTFAVSRYEDAIVTCTVDSNPEEATFQWTFNNTADTIDVPPGRYTTANSHSIITYTPVTSLDYGTLLCWASNEIGSQKEPCLYHIVPAGKPEPPSNCSISRHLRTSLRVICQPGSNGGFQQVFHLKILHNGTPLMNLTNEIPDFKVENLMPGEKYRLTITSENERGSSYATHLSATMKPLLASIYEDGPSEAEVRDGSQGNNGLLNTPASSSSLVPSSSKGTEPPMYFEGLDPQSILPLAMGVGAGLILVIIVLLILITMKAKVPFQRYRRSHSNNTMVTGSIHDITTSPEPDMTIPEPFPLSCANKNSQQESGSEIDASGSIVQKISSTYGYNIANRSDTAGASTLLPRHQYALADMPKLVLPTHPLMTTRQVGMSHTSEIDQHVKSINNQNRKIPVATKRPMCISSTLPRTSHLQCVYQQGNLESSGNTSTSVSRDLESMTTLSHVDIPRNVLYNDIDNVF